MNFMRAILIGALIWLFIFLTFALVDNISFLKGSLNAQTTIVALLIIPFAAFGASIYYKKGSTANGLLLGLIMAFTALILDALITVPLIELPKGNTYESFFSYPILWLLVVLNIATIYVYWRFKISEN